MLCNQKVLKVVTLTVFFSIRNADGQNIVSPVWSLGNSQKLLKTNQFLVSTIFFTIMNFSFFSLRFDLFSIIGKEVNQIRNNVVCVVACYIFLFCCALTTGRCNVFQQNLENLKKTEFYGTYFQRYQSIQVSLYLPFFVTFSLTQNREAACFTGDYSALINIFSSVM